MSTQPEPELVEEKVRREASPRQIAMIAGAAVLLLILFWFLFLRGGGDEAPEETLPQAPAPTVTDVPTEGGGGGGKGKGDKPGEGPVETTEVFASRDPFKPLLSSGAADGETTDTGDTTETDTTDTTTDDTDDGTVIDGETEDGADAETGDGTGGESVEGHTVELIGINGSGDDRTAQIQVDDTIYTVEEGETFAENFELLSTSSECATVLFGDDQFTVCEGEEILK